MAADSTTSGYDYRGAHLLALLLAGGEPGEAGRMRRRLGESEPRYLTWVPLSAEARANAARDPDPLVRRALIRAEGVTSDDLAALLERPDPVTDRQLYEHRSALPWMRRLVLTPGRHADPAALAPLRERILSTQRELPGIPHFVAAGVVSDAPEVVEHALRVCGRAMTSAEQFRGVLGLLDHPERLRALLDSADAPLRPAVAEQAHAALGTDGAALRAAVTAAESAEGLVAGLRAGEAEPCRRRTFEWDALVSAHLADPLPEAAVRFLAQQPECPEPVLAELYRTHPTVVAGVARPCATLVRAAAGTPGHPELVRICTALSADGTDRPAGPDGTGTNARAGQAGAVGRSDEADIAAPSDDDLSPLSAPSDDDLSPLSAPSDDSLSSLSALILDTVTPARTAAIALAELGPSRPVRESLHRRLGADPKRWATLRTTLSRYKGTLAALLAAIADGEAPAGSAKPPALTKPYRFLLYAAEPGDLSGLLPRLPDELLTALLGKGSLPPHALDTALAAGDPRVAAAIGGNVALGVRELRRLTELDEPAVNASVFRHQKVTLSLCRAIASGVPRTPGRTEPVPLDAGLRAELLGETYKHQRTPLVTIGDPELVHHAWRFLSEDGQHYAVVRVWERAGEEGVRRLLGLFPEDAVTAHPVLARAAATGDLGRFKEDLHPFDDPDTLCGILTEPRGRNATRRLVYTLVHEPYAYDFTRLAAAHRAVPFQPEPLAELLRHEDVDEAVREALTVVSVNQWLDSKDHGADPVELLRSTPYPGWQWFTRAVEGGFVDPERLVDTAHPAHEVLGSLRHFDDAVAGRARRYTAELVREHLAGHPEGWVVALGLVGTYAGTLAELIQVAAQVAGPRPDATELARRDAGELARVTAELKPAATAPQLTQEEERALRKELEPLSTPAAVHLLRTLVPGSPLPTGARVLRTLAGAEPYSVPGVERPDWLIEACAAHNSSTTGEPLVPKERRGIPLSALDDYRHGFAAPSELVARTPAREMNPVPKQWRTHHAEGPQLRAARALIAEQLGTDTGRWLRALSAMNNGWADRTFGEVLSEGDAGRDATCFTPLGGRLLLHADVAALTAVMPLLGPDATVALTEHACASAFLPDDLVTYLFGSDDRAALLALTRSWRELYRDRELQLRLLGLDDPAVNAALYGNAFNGPASVAVRRMILSRRPRGRVAEDPGDLVPLAPELRETLLKSSYLVTGSEHRQRVQLEAADPEIVEHALASWGKRRPLLDHLLAARASLRYGGRDQLRSLAERGLLKPAAAKFAVKALESADPDAVIADRLDRELGPERLVTRLRACVEYGEQDRVLELPYMRDWEILLKAHEQEPFSSAVWSALGDLPDAPDAVTAASMTWERLRDRAAIGRGPDCARAAVAHRYRAGSRATRSAMFDFLGEHGLITGADLVHHASGAAGVLHYLAEGAVRRELPAAVRTFVREATDEVAELATKLLKNDEPSWKRLFAALTGGDINWLRPGCTTTVAALLEHSARTPL
ncbi:hypothetical protein [Streptomyces lutosisoli]|uniref:Uncharacterized protein n=1 Tax=Streptomyces lutosisoli TaxID=2665721 RepID=A0ABW2VBD4_9ACTN